MKLGFERLDQLPMEGVRVVHQGVEGAYSMRRPFSILERKQKFYHVAQF